MKNPTRVLHKDLRTWIEIDRKAIAHNYRIFRKHFKKKDGKDPMMMAVVKSNAYGHNIHEFAHEMARLGADWIGVDSIKEAIALRDGKLPTRLLVLGFTLPVLYDHARKHGVSLTISSFAQLKEVCKLKRGVTPLRIHIKVDTGMHRQGFQLYEAEELLSALAKADPKVVRVEGLYTHFAEAKDPRQGDTTKRQIAEFEKWIALFHEAGHNPIRHAAATGGAMLYLNAHFDMVRIGIGCYGLWPSEEAKYHLAKAMPLQPVLTWKTTVGEVKDVRSGERVGYDFTQSLNRNSRLAVLPVGYWHGIPRLLSSKGRVLISGSTAPIIGRVSMDMIVVDVTDIPKVKMGDEAVLIGCQGKEEIHASELASYAATTHYEIVTRINPLIKRFYK